MDLSLLVQYIEGKWTAEDFREILLYNDLLCDLVKRFYAEAIGSDDYNVISKIELLNFAKKEDVILLNAIIERILKYCNYHYNKKQEVKNELSVDEILLPYLKDDMQAENFVYNKIFSEMPKGLTKKEQKEFCKNKQKEFFRYESEPPKWVQSGEWQFNSEGYPLIFKYSNKKDNESEEFVFFDPLTEKLVKIIQYY